MAVVVDDVDRAGVYAQSSQGRRVQPAATNRHSHISTRRWWISGFAVKQGAYDRSRDFPAQLSGRARALYLLGTIDQSRRAHGDEGRLGRDENTGKKP